MVDHHAVARQFMLHQEREMKAGRTTYAEWIWIVPPLSGLTTPVLHKARNNEVLNPNFYYQPAPWRSGAEPGRLPIRLRVALE
jgi:nitric-oxide synthase, bacterial